MAAPSQVINITLAELLPTTDLASASELSVTGLVLDSRAAQVGDVFIALVGAHHDGRKFIAHAVARGVVAILVAADNDWQGLNWLSAVPVIAINNLAQEVSAIAARFYQDPSAQLSVTGITGTNGKTTCSLLLAQVFSLLHIRTGVLGTVGCGLLDQASPLMLPQQIENLQATGLTTPDPITVQQWLAKFQQQGAGNVVMEVSSHSLVQARVAAVHFECALFTNLTQDHLDYHGDLKAYGRAKQLLLQARGLRHAIINIDDAWAKSLLAQCPETVQALSYSISDASAEVYAKNIQLLPHGLTAEVVTPWGETQLRSNLLGKFNLSNLLAVLTAACAQGFALADVVATFSQLQAIPGRMESVVLEQRQQDINVIVDFAHTPDALENTLNALRQHQPGRIWTVFGCGGDRDKTKRPLMGRIVERLSDCVIVTNDNPRSEDPAVIAAEILRGMSNAHSCLVIADRATAIELAVQQAKAGDIVLIAGKGHENAQIFSSHVIPFSDVKQARLALQQRLNKLDNSGAIL